MELEYKIKLYKDVIKDILCILDNNEDDILSTRTQDYVKVYYQALDDIENLYFKMEEQVGDLETKPFDYEGFDVLEQTVECLSNENFEDSFEVGVSYILRNEDSDELITVEDMNGHDKTVLRERFGEIINNYRKEVGKCLINKR